MAVDNYDPGMVTANIGGIILNGFADGSMIRVERTSEAFSKVVGADGRVVRVRSRDRSARVTVNLLSTSPSNAQLAALAAADEAFGTGVVPLMVKNIIGNENVIGGSAWIVKRADMDFAKDHQPREWVFDVAELEYVGQ